MMKTLYFLLSLASLCHMSKITFTLGKRQVKCFKDDFAADTVLYGSLIGLGHGSLH